MGGSPIPIWVTLIGLLLTIYNNLNVACAICMHACFIPLSCVLHVCACEGFGS